MRKLSECCNDRKNNLDFIRFVAAALVIYSHAFPVSCVGRHDQLAEATNGAWYIGILCVACFFVISGFLIAQSYDRSNNPAKFIKARMLRILPGFVLVILLSTFVLGPIITTLPLREYFTHSQTWQYLKSVFMYPLYWNLPGVFENNIYGGSVNGSLWTIPYEMFFYGVVLVLGIFGLLKKKKTGLMFFFLFAFLELFKTKLYPTGGYFMTLPRYDFIELGLFFSSGVMLYTYREHIVMDKHYAMISLLMLIILGAVGQFIVPFALFGAYLIMYAGYGVKPVFSNFSKYGDFSYGIYIYGWPVQQIVTYSFGGSMDPYVNTVISLIIVLVLAVLSWYFIEKPAMSLKKVRFLPKIKFVDKLGEWIMKGMDKLQSLVSRICNLGWVAFFVLVIAGFVLANTLLAPPSVVEFPYEKDSIFVQGWLTQSPSEDYRWVQQDSIVKLDCPNNVSAFVLEGYIPENFTEVNNVAVYIGDQLIYQAAQGPGSAIAVNQSISGISGEVQVRIVFDGVHAPSSGEADQRTMSALITKIGFIK